ncbi:MAG TPA: SDR family oxidoreductase [Candidatus Nanopelagicaceae bacterium]|nr:SDR family oxidoreductase [Candidatus Nanopelagicaceae bacterium]
MGYSKKSILITGASSGIGRACAEYLALNGFKIYAGARKKEDIEALNGIKNVIGLKIDVTDDQTVKKAFNFVKNENSGLFAIINNAGIASAGPLMDISTNDLINQFNVNLIGIHRITSTFFPLILKSKGRIIMISSNSGFFAAPFFGPYSASKFALEGYSDSLRRELLLYDVKVIIIQPGRIKTPIWIKGEELLLKFKGSMFEKEAVFIGKHEIEKGKNDSLDPKEVAKIILKALTTKKPKNRYMIVPNVFRNKMLKTLSSKRIDNILKKELAKIKNKKN